MSLLEYTHGLCGITGKYGNKKFNNLERAALDDVNMAYKEAKEWFDANHHVEARLDGSPDTNVSMTPSAIFACYIDGSWKKGDRTCGIGWVLQLQDETTDILGMHGGSQSISPFILRLIVCYGQWRV